MKRVFSSLLLSSLAVLAGCAHQADTSLVSIEAAPAIELSPTLVGNLQSPLKVGDIVVYDNPVQQWQVINKDARFIYWRSTNGDNKVTSHSLLLPSLRWHGISQSGSRAIKDLTGDVSSFAVGNRYQFNSVELNNEAAVQRSALWDCQVTQQLQVVVPAGSADTFEVLCKIDGKERFLVNYSADLGHIVRSVKVLANGQSIERKLTAFQRTP